MLNVIYPKILELEKDTLKTIEAICKVNGMINNEGLYEQMQFDEAIVNSLKVQMKNINDSFDNMVLKLNQTNDYRVFTTNDPINVNIEAIIKNTPKFIRDDLVYESTIYNQIDLNGNTLQIYCTVSEDYDVSPLEKYVATHFVDKNNNKNNKKNNKKNRNCEIFDKNYYIWNVNKNKGIWIPEITMFHIKNLQFFHGANTVLRVDPVELIDVLNVKRYVHPIKTFKEYRWENNGIIGGKLDASETKRTNIYDVHVYKNRTHICIRFKNNNWLLNNLGIKVKIMGINMIITNEYEMNKWYSHKIVHKNFIIENDTSELNNHIRITETETLEEQGKLIFDDILDMMSINRSVLID